MTLYDFFTLSVNDMGKYLKSKGLSTYYDIPLDQNKFCEILDLTNDERITYWHTYQRCGLSIHTKINVECEHLSLILPLSISFKGHCKATLQSIGDTFNNIIIYEKVCPLYDNRPDYNNLSFSLNEEEIPCYITNNTPILDCINNIKILSNEFYPYIKQIEEISLNGEFEKSYDKFNFNKFKKGAGILTNENSPSFPMLVRAFYNMEKIYDIYPSLDEVMALYVYASYNRYKIQQNFSNKKTMIEYIFELFGGKNKISPEVTRDMIIEWINFAKKDRDVNADSHKKSFAITYTELNKDFYYRVEEIKKELVLKYGIPEKYIPSMPVYNPKYEDRHLWRSPVPEELTNFFK